MHCGMLISETTYQESVLVYATQRNATLQMDMLYGCHIGFNKYDILAARGSVI